ncbi:MAG: putative porin [Bacteroidia bacterium]|nr:putative porin [Bacteroidia bacterium]
MKRASSVSLFFLISLVIAQSPSDDSMSVMVQYRYPTHSSPRLNFPMDTIPYAFIPQYFHWMGMYGLNRPEYLFRYRDPQTDWVWNSGITLSGGIIHPFHLRSNKHFIRLKGTAGSRQWQDFQGIFSFPAFRKKGQNTIFLNRCGGQGFYNNQQTFLNNLMASSEFENRRWGYAFYAIFRSQKFKENGGLRWDTIFSWQEEMFKEFLPVKFYSANVRNTNHNAGLDIYKILQINEDSSEKANTLKIGLTASFRKITHQYLHQNVKSDGYYALYYLDTLNTNDSISFLEFGTGPAAEFKTNNVSCRAYYRFSTGKIYNFYDSTFRRGIAGFQTTYAWRNVYIVLYGQYVLHGFWKNSFAFGIKTNLRHRLLDTLADLTLNASAEKRYPDGMLTGFYGNHFQWAASPVWFHTRQMQIAYGTPWLTLKCLIIQNKNYFFFDERAYPFMLNSPLLRAQYSLILPVKVLKIWKTDAEFTYQTSDASPVFRFPSYFLRVRTMADLHLFKRNLWLQAGAELTYIPEFVPYSYMPNTQVFYLKDNLKTQPYLWISPFISARVSPAQFFVRAENVGYLFSRQNIAWVPSYFQPGFWLHVGVMWDFRD